MYFFDLGKAHVLTYIYATLPIAATVFPDLPKGHGITLTVFIYSNPRSNSLRKTLRFPSFQVIELHH